MPKNKAATLTHALMSEIYEGERFREDMGDIEGLASSICEHGLIAPLAVCPSDVEGFKYKLLAGGRRFNACKFAELTEPIPLRVYPDNLSDYELRSIELEENIRRKDLTWQEEVNLCKEIHELQIKIHGIKVSTAPDAPGHSLRDTAKMVDESPAGVSNKLKLSKAMEEFPDMPWDKCKTQSDANKLLKKVSRHLIRDDLVAAARASYNDDNKKTRIASCYIVKDFFEALDDLQDNLFNLVEIDPPYAIDLTKQKKKYGYEGYNEVVEADYKEFMLKVLKGCYRKMAPDSWLILWFAPEPWFESMYQWLIESGFKTHRMCGIWNKHSGQTLNPDKRLANAYEMFFYASKGNPKLAKPGTPNIYDYTVGGDKKFHPTQRPVDMIEDVISTFAHPNSNVLVPFAGSGATLIAAAKQEMHPIGYDLTDHYKKEFQIWLESAL